jgi:hypothetical protein
MNKVQLKILAGVESDTALSKETGIPTAILSTVGDSGKFHGRNLHRIVKWLKSKGLPTGEFELREEVINRFNEKKLPLIKASISLEW